MIKVYFNSPAYMIGLEIYVIEKNEINGKSYLLNFGKFATTWEEIKPFEAPPKPTFVFSGNPQEFLKAVGDAINERGIKTDEDSRRQGKLEAIERHLEDMRTLLFRKTDG